MTVSADLPEKKTRRLLAVPSLKWQNWLLLGIKLAMGLLLILLIMLYFVLRRDEADKQHSTMIVADACERWVARWRNRRGDEAR